MFVEAREIRVGNKEVHYYTVLVPCELSSGGLRAKVSS